MGATHGKKMSSITEPRSGFNIEIHRLSTNSKKLGKC